jgi:hypothetical protein
MGIVEDGADRPADREALARVSVLQRRLDALRALGSQGLSGSEKENLWNL